MSLNQFMHPRNIYRKPPDFKQMAIAYPEFRRHVVQNLDGRVTLDFKDPAALCALTKTLLKKDFGLDVEIPSDRLVPAVPQRLNYLLWVEDLLEALPEHCIEVTGVDIGTGASCILPLLGNKNGWKFLASERESESLKCAQENVNRNKLQDKIKVVKVEPDCILKGLIDSHPEPFDFCVCNPPFFRDAADAAGKSMRVGRPPPHATPTASKEESIIEGGELQFVRHLIDESVELKGKVRIYTSMLGKKATFLQLQSDLTKKGIAFATTEFCQGKTTRWGIAWTFLAGVNFSQVTPMKHRKMKPPFLYLIPKKLQDIEYSVAGVVGKIRMWLDELPISYEVEHEGKTSSRLRLWATENTWSHQRRKRREQKMQQPVHDDPPSARPEPETDLAADLSDESNCHIVIDGGRVVTIHSAECQSKKGKNGIKSVSVAPTPAPTFWGRSDPVSSVHGKKSREESKAGPSGEPTAKKPRLQEMAHSTESANSLPGSSKAMANGVEPSLLLDCYLEVSMVGQTLALKMQVRDATAARDTVYQVMQYMKNRLQ